MPLLKVFVAQSVVDVPPRLVKAAKKAACAAAKLEHKKGKVALLFTDDEHIRKLNKEFRNIDSDTDVLSFPSDEKRFLGDIAISYPCALRQAHEFGHPPAREIAFLTVHAMLHLVGYDHLCKKDETKMRERQREILKSAGFLTDEEL